VGAGVGLGRVEVVADAGAGLTYPTDRAYTYGLDPGWGFLGGGRARLRIPVGRVLVRPGVELGFEHREQRNIFYEEPRGRTGARATATAELVLPAANGWLAIGMFGGYGTLPRNLLYGLTIHVGTTL
jgi:hypothetical protein